MKKTKIEWCDATVNPVVGCKNNCEYCYARKLNNRFHFVEDFSKPQFFPERLKQLYSKKPQNIFMNSMSDVSDWKPEWLTKTFHEMSKNQQHRYIFLSKDGDKLGDKLLKNKYGTLGTYTTKMYDETLFIGDTITRQNDIYAPSSNIINIEPILEGIKLNKWLSAGNYKWIIIGAETGNRKGKVIPKKEWIDDIVKSCNEHSIPVFMKESLLPIMGEENMRREFPKELQKGVGYSGTDR